MLSSPALTRRRRTRLLSRVGARPAAPLFGLARRHLRAATWSSTGRSAQVVCGLPGGGLCQTVVAARAGTVLVGDRPQPGHGWTAQVLVGQVQLRDERARWSGWPGDLLGPGHGRSELYAVTDAVVLLSAVDVATERPRARPVD